jgi:hypothetical protein
MQILIKDPITKWVGALALAMLITDTPAISISEKKGWRNISAHLCENTRAPLQRLY